ncbi:6606_t:CDS:2, partial [Dentiscutata erythropus]
EARGRENLKAKAQGRKNFKDHILPTKARGGENFKDICCGPGGPGVNGSVPNTGNRVTIISNTNTAEGCCRHCYENPRCIWYFINLELNTCHLIGSATDPLVNICDSYVNYVNDNFFASGTSGCGFCQVNEC